MDDTRDSQSERTARRVRPTQRWHWQAALAALVALLAVEGQPVPASYATAVTAGAAGHVAHLGRSMAPQSVHADAATGTDAAREASAPAVDARPDFQVAFSHLDDAEAGRPFSYTLQVRNDGGTGGAVSLNTILPPELSNVRVTAPGFVCTRRFAASGPQAGTLVSCMRSDLESGAVADVTIEANAPATLGVFHLTATADPRDEVSETDEANNEADATVEVSRQ
jgi:CARDB protein